MPRNARSLRVIEKLGFRREGYAERYLQIAGKWEDHIVFARTREEHVPGRARERRSCRENPRNPRRRRPTAQPMGIVRRAGVGRAAVFSESSWRPRVRRVRRARRAAPPLLRRVRAVRDERRRAADRASTRVFEYGGAVATAIARFKYAGRSDLAARFADVMASRSEDDDGTRGALGDVDLVVPVPLHPRRLVERGFDQAALLAMPIARRRGVRCAPPRPRPNATHAAAGLARSRRALRQRRRRVPVPGAGEGARPQRAPRRRRAHDRGDARGVCRRARAGPAPASVGTLVLASRDRPGIVQKTARRRGLNGRRRAALSWRALDEQRPLAVGGS